MANRYVTAPRPKMKHESSATKKPFSRNENVLVSLLQRLLMINLSTSLDLVVSTRANRSSLTRRACTFLILRRWRKPRTTTPSLLSPSSSVMLLLPSPPVLDLPIQLLPSPRLLPTMGLTLLLLLPPQPCLPLCMMSWMLSTLLIGDRDSLGCTSLEPYSSLVPRALPTPSIYFSMIRSCYVTISSLSYRFFG